MIIDIPPLKKMFYANTHLPSLIYLAEYEVVRTYSCGDGVEREKKDEKLLHSLTLNYALTFRITFKLNKLNKDFALLSGPHGERQDITYELVCVYARRKCEDLPMSSLSRELKHKRMRWMCSMCLIILAEEKTFTAPFR